MSIVKLNNRSVKDVTAFGSISSLGSLTHIATQTASSSSTISFTSGIDSTYKEYIFYFVNIHAQTDDAHFMFQGNAVGQSGFNETITSSHFRSYHTESDSATNLSYGGSSDLAQSTSFQRLMVYMDNDNDSNGCGFLHLFNPSGTVGVKHFLSTNHHVYNSAYSWNSYTAGYFNTTSAIDEIQFKMSTGYIDSGQILLFGLS